MAGLLVGATAGAVTCKTPLFFVKCDYSCVRERKTNAGGDDADVARNCGRRMLKADSRSTTSRSVSNAWLLRSSVAAGAAV